MAYPVYPLINQTEFLGDTTPPDESTDPVSFWGRQPPSQINVIIIGSGGGSIGGGGGGGGVVILNNLTTGFFPTLGARSLANKTTFRVTGRNKPAGNTVSNGFETVFTTYNSDGSTKNEYTAIGGGYGNSSTDQDVSRPGNAGGSGGGAGGSPPNRNRANGGAGTGTQGKAGGAGFFEVAYINPRLYYIYGTGGGGGYSQAGTAGNNSFITLTGGNGGNGLSLAPYLSSVLQNALTDGTSLPGSGYSNYSSIWAASGAGGFTSTYGVFAAGTPGIGAGKSIEGQHTATGFGGGAAVTGSGLLGEAGGGLAIMSYAGGPYTYSGYIHYDGTRTYHMFLGPPDSVNQRGAYANWTSQM